MERDTLVSVEEYLSTSYRPDREYVDGQLVQRNMGERDHSELQMALSAFVSALGPHPQRLSLRDSLRSPSAPAEGSPFNRRTTLGIHVFPEQRVQVKKTRFRVPDVCVVAGKKPAEQIFTSPPFLCIEILSKDDRMLEMQDRIDDYLAFGVSYVWLIDPRTKRARVYSREGSHEVKDALRTREPEIVVPLAELFPE
jgi:Uma2 family endonuclease